MSGETGLSLITAAVVHWNTVYLDGAVRQLRAQNVVVPDELLAHVATLGREHIAAVTPEPGLQPLRDVRAAFLPRRLSVQRLYQPKTVILLEERVFS